MGMKRSLASNVLPLSMGGLSARGRKARLRPSWIDPRDRRLHALQLKFRAVHARIDNPRRVKRQMARWGRFALPWALALAVIVLLSPWPVSLTLRHLAAFPNCDAARFAGLAPSRRGGPGYHDWHDEDGDGLACEPRPY